MRSWSANIQSQYVILLFLIPVLLIGFSPNSPAQTVTMNDATVVSNTARAGLNLQIPSGSYPNFKNYYAYANPGFEPMMMKQIYQFQSPQDTSSPTTFRWNAPNTQYEGYDANQWAGATFTVIQGCYPGISGCVGGGTSDPALGCTGTIASSANHSGAGPTFVTNPTTNQGSNGCAGNLGVAGQLIVVSTNLNMATIFPTPASTWSSGNGQNGNVFGITASGGATFTSETTDLCATCGLQSIQISVPASGSLTLGGGVPLNTASEKTVTLNGTYTMSFWAKSSAATPPNVSFSLGPRSGTSCTQVYSGTTSPAITSTWKQFSFNCTFDETPAGGGPYGLYTTIIVKPVGGVATSLLFDNLSLTNAADSNPTVYNDAYVNSLKAWCQSTSNTTGPACTMRYSAHPDSETMANWVKTPFEHQPTIETMTAISTAFSTLRPGINDFLNLCAYIGATPVLIFPTTTTTADAVSLVDFLQGSTSTPFGLIRSNLGQSTPWVGASGSPFSKIYLEFGNENWNGGFLGHGLPPNPSAPTGATAGAGIYYDYAVRMAVVLAAAKAEQSSEGYSQTATQWVINLFPGDYGLDMVKAMTIAHPDAGEINGYTAHSIADTSTTGCLTSGATNATCPLFGPTLTEAWSNTHDPNSQSDFYQSISAIQGANVCGSSGTAQCKSMVYEENTGPTGETSTSGPFTQAVSDTFTQAAVQGVVAADQMGENDAAGVDNQNVFTDLQYYYQTGGVNTHMWGVMIDTGGDCSVANSSLYGGSYCPRPQMLGAQVYNWCKIGPMVQTSWTSNPTYNLPANNNSVNAISNVPILRSFAFAEGSERCMVIVNSDVYSSHKVTFSGTNAPTTGVTTYQFAPPSLSATNEAGALSDTSTTQATMWNTTAPGVNVTSGYSLPPYSVTAFMWQTNGTGATPTAAAPVFSVAPGSYTTSQTVAISSSTSGATIYYTTNGATPTTSSTKYAGPITVSSSETIQAFAAASGYTNSAVATAAYTIAGAPAAPTFSMPSGTYSNSTLTITDSTSGAAIYYTTNGATPTSSSTLYSAPITFNSSATITVEAVAVANGLTSPVTTATYTIQPGLAKPVFSPAPGSYTSSQTVSISDVSTGAKIYYTTNGSTPTTSSAVYTGPMTVSSTETINAMATLTGFTNSPVVTAVYTMSSTLPAPVFSVAAGTYTSTQTVAISDSISAAAIYYTTNGTTPTTSSSRYTAPITVSSTQTIEAIAVATGYTNSAVAAAAYTITTPSGPATAPSDGNSVFNITSFAASPSLISMNGNAALDGTKLQLTNGSTFQNSSAWYATPVNVKSFSTNITFQLSSAVADGFTFTVQGAGTNALGGGGAGLGYSNISPSVGLKLDLDNISGVTGSTGLYTNGAAPYTSTGTLALASSGINLRSGHVMTLELVYNGTVLTMTLTDTVTLASYTTSFTVNIPSIVGSTAYVGFTAASGGSGADQEILAWSYSTSATLAPPKFSVAAGTYTSAQTVAITAASGVTIYYTTDGTTPTTSSTQYTEPITVSSTQTIEAIAAAARYTNSAVATAAYTIVAPGAPAGNVFDITSFAASPSLISMNGNAALDGTKLQLTNGSSFQNSSAWYATPVDVNSFTTNITFQLSSAVADGFTFTVQGAGTKALGGGGAGLGYSNISPSVGLKIDLDNISGVIGSTGLYTNGAVPYTSTGTLGLASSGINIRSGHVMTLQLVYNGSVLTMTLTDTVTLASFTTSFTVNIPSIVGGNTAYVGFTGASGGSGADQEILAWSYSN